MTRIKNTAYTLNKMLHMRKGIGMPSVIHALVVIFAEFFAWGLLTTPTIRALKQTFPDHTLMINGLIWGIKGTLSFLTSPLIGYCSDVFGRKLFLMITVMFTCLPIPMMLLSEWWYFIMIAISGLFSVTFSVVFAYVADVTTDSNRSSAYGQVSATFAASMIISPALGAYLSRQYSENLVILLATVVAALDVLFIMFVVPESLPEKFRPQQISLWEQADPLSTMRKIGRDFMIWTLCLTVFLSYLPEAGQYSCFFVYLKLIIGFSDEHVALFIAFIGLLSVLAQTLLLIFFIDRFGGKNTIMIGLLMQGTQLFLLSLGRNSWLMWFTGIVASLSSITYPAISAYISTYADSDKQGLVQGLITGVRSLCGGIGPALFGVLFNYYDVDMYGQIEANPYNPHTAGNPLQPSISSPIVDRAPTINNPSQLPGEKVPSLSQPPHRDNDRFIVGPPFLFGAFLVILATIVAKFIPDSIISYRRCSTKSNSPTNYYQYTSISNSNGSLEINNLSNIGSSTMSLAKRDIIDSGD